MTALRRGVALAGVSLLLAVGCVQRGVSTRVGLSDAAISWPAALGNAQRAAEAGRHAEADRTLERFATDNRDAPQAAEALYWRALFALDPANRSATPRAALATLELYLARPGIAHRAEALVLRRTAAALDTLGVTLARRAETPPPPAPAAAVDRAREEEMQQLRDSLTKTSAELERIRRRLAPPPRP